MGGVRPPHHGLGQCSCLNCEHCAWTCVRAHKRPATHACRHTTHAHTKITQAHAHKHTHTPRTCRGTTSGFIQTYYLSRKPPDALGRHSGTNIPVQVRASPVCCSAGGAATARSLCPSASTFQGSHLLQHTHSNPRRAQASGCHTADGVRVMRGRCSLCARSPSTRSTCTLTLVRRPQPTPPAGPLAPGRCRAAATLARRGRPGPAPST